MAIAIKDNTTALEALKIKAQSLPNKSDSSGGGTTTNGYDTSNADASSSDVLSPRIFYNADGEQTGTMVNKGSLSQTITSNGTQSYDAGYYSGGTITVSVPTGSGNTSTVPVATPTIDINTSGQITATVNQSAGTTSGGTQTATAWLSDDYDADFVSSNIKSGVTIFGVQGTYTGASTDFTQVTAEASEVKEGKYFYNSSGNLEEGTMPNADIDFYGVVQDQDNRAVVYVNIDVAGYVERGTVPIGDMVVLESDQYALNITNEGTFGITTENKFMLDNVRVTVDAGDDFKPENIVQDKTILGITGTYRGSSLNQYVDYPEYSKTLFFKEVSNANTYYIVKEDQTERTSTTGCVAVMSALLDFSNDTQYVYIYDNTNVIYQPLLGSDGNVRLTIETVEAGDATAIQLSGVFDNTHHDNDFNITYVTEKLEFYGRYKVYAF